jgi:hypothetical protein
MGGVFTVRPVPAVLFLLAASVATGPAAWADTVDATPLDTVIVTAKLTDVAGTSQSASAGIVGGVELSQRPILRQGELLEAVPGMIVTAHTSGGKANQYYLRGFNLDHGTDVATSVDGVPVNLGTHAHGQGYMDLNWLIPELVAGIAFRKGPYYADAGDFSAAGNASIGYLSTLPSNVVQAEAGTDNYERALVAGSGTLGPGALLYAAEYIHDDGPSTVPGNYRRPNGLLKYTVGDSQVGGGISVQAYDARWTANDQLPVAAIPLVAGGRFGTLDPTSTGFTARYSLAGEWHWGGGGITHSVQAYVFKYDLNLYSDFSGFVDPVHGDQFRQYDNRIVAGGAEKTTLHGAYLGRSTEDSFGVQLRNDFVDTELDHTQARTILELYRRDASIINSAAAYWSNAIVWTPWLRTEGGLRLEGYHFHLNSNTAANSGDTALLRPAPKIGVTLTPRADVDVYGQAGVSYRSNDTRGIFDRVPAYAGGPQPAEPSKPLVRSEGGEVGVRLRTVPGLTATVAFWYLQSNSELFFAGDTGSNDDSDRPGQRYGVEINTIYNPVRWMTVDADFAQSQAFFTDHDKAVGDRIPEAIRSSASMAFIAHDLGGAPGFTGSLRMRYFGSRDLIEDGSQTSAPVTVFNGRLGYQVNRRLALGLEALNLFNARYNDAEYYDSYRLKGQLANPLSADGSYMGHVIHPGEPLQVRLSAAVKY